MPYSYRPLSNIVLLKKPVALDDNGLTVGGIIVPAEYQKTFQQRNTPFITLPVQAVGPDAKTIKPGDRVIFNQNSVPPLPLNDGEEFFLIPEDQVLAIVDELPDITISTSSVVAVA